MCRDVIMSELAETVVSAAVKRLWRCFPLWISELNIFYRLIHFIFLYLDGFFNYDVADWIDWTRCGSVVHCLHCLHL